MRNLRTEDEIIANWKGEIEKPIVSICCITYNHESYIEDALEGFLIQETYFPFEILIHDDASSDRTAEIIREYEIKYPRLIKPIYQTENQYSKGLKINPTFNFSRANGEYIAMCEGDDYWIVADKLQMQTELMRQYPEINISFHPAYKVDGNVLKKDEVLSYHSKDIKIFTPKQVILGGGGFMPTASLLIRSKLVKKLPDWFHQYAPVGDLYLQSISSSNGALFFSSIKSIYRINTPQSWTTSQASVSLNALNKEVFGHQYCLKKLVNYGYEVSDINRSISRELFYSALKALKIKEFYSYRQYINLSKRYYFGLNKTQKVFVLLSRFPRIAFFLIHIRKRLFN